ncbi:MAG TPA: hypothetical protein VEG34_05595 [Thermoanaerobaculia bacterium]|nr:hypothetical protein [Thermoanaerobaculia bacterium]
MAHPTFETLEHFLRGELSGRRLARVLGHLRPGCRECEEELETLAAILLVTQPAARRERAQRPAPPPAPRPAPPPASPPASPPIPAAQPLPEPQAARPPAAPTWELCEELMAESAALRRDDPAGTVRAARAAVAVARRLDPRRYGPGPLNDLQARAWAELGNAYRIHDELQRAEQAFGRAARLAARGTGSSALAARVAELTAALRAHQRRFADAFADLTHAESLYRRDGDRTGTGRVLVSKGLYSSYDGDLASALLFLQEGLGQLDAESDSQLRLLALHNIALCRIEQGRFREARTALFQLLPLYHRHAGRMDWVRRRWLEGRIAAGLGELDKAERELLAARGDFEQAGLAFATAIVDLDLVAVWLRQGRTEEIYRAVGGLVDAFREIGVEREALGAVLLLAEALSRDGMTLELVEATAHVLRRLERNQSPVRAWRAG